MDLLEEQEDNELFVEGENLDASNEQIENNQEEDENDAQEEKKDVKPKRVVRNPRPKLNAELLKGPKGLGNLEKCFERVQFKGKGYEEQDLKVLLKTYEHWCHRLFPKLPFKDCVETIERLGSKGPIQTHLKKVRSGLIDDETDNPTDLPEFQSDEEGEASASNDHFSSQPTITEEQVELTEEQIETIRRNRERAEKLRQERLRRIQEKASVNLPDSQKPGCTVVCKDVVVSDNNAKHSLEGNGHEEENDTETSEIQGKTSVDLPDNQASGFEEVSYNAEDQNSLEKERHEEANYVNKEISCDEETSINEHINTNSDSETEFRSRKKHTNQIFDDEDEGADSDLPHTPVDHVENMEVDE